ncbi:hypothetical protein BHE74_00022142 [Ensete ventricosum]|nr:hypothetical protein BHE74_00022142 [Ensete ventricosum]
MEFPPPPLIPPSTSKRTFILSHLQRVFCQQSIEELKHKLICAAAEREELRISTRNELQKANETIRRLMDLLEVRTHERDEARRKLQLLLNQTIQPTTVELPILPLHLPLDVPQRGQSRGSSPADAVDSPQLSSMNMGDSCDDMGISRELMFSAFKAMSSARLAMKRPLPERGRFQQAVLGAGPLLLNLIFPQSQVASASVTARDSPGLEQTSFPNPEGLIPCPLSSTR